MGDAVDVLQVPAVVVESAVVEGAEQDSVADVGGSVRLARALVPGLDVCGFASSGWDLAALPDAAAVAQGHRVALLFGEQPPGLAQVEAAKADGRWDAAYGSTWEVVTPPQFLAALAENEKAKATFDTLSRAERYSIGWRLATVKRPETRQRQIAVLLSTLEQGEKPR